MNIAQQFRQEGHQAGRLEVAKAMLRDHKDLTTVAGYTKLSLDELKALQRELDS